MASLRKLTLTGKSGTKYQFEIYEIGTSFSAIGGVYAFTKRYEKSDGNFSHGTIYIGETEDLSTRFDNHHKQGCIERENSNCISIHPDENEESRLAKEKDILENYEWTCND